jgi:hypothetical protein
VKKLIAELSAAASGQLAMALPLVMVSVFLARTAGLTAVGYFSAATGVTAVAYQASLFGLRHLIVVDNLRSHGFSHYVFLRTLLIIVLLPPTIAAGIVCNVPFTYILIGISIRIGDAFVDLNLAYDQVTMVTQTAVRQYSRIAFIKLGIFSALMLIPLLHHNRLSTLLSPEWLVIVASIIFAALCIRETWSRTAGTWPLHRRSAAKSTYVWLLSKARWYFAASLACAAVTAMPRFMLPALTSGKLFGVAGATLSAVTFFGMMYYASWLRNAARLSSSDLSLRLIGRFAVENAVIFTLLLLGSITVFPLVVSRMFGFHEHALIVFSGQVMIAGGALFAVMNFANLFKGTKSPWLETLSYGVPATAAIALHFLGLHFTILGLMAFLSTGMAICILTGLIWSRSAWNPPASLSSGAQQIVE